MTPVSELYALEEIDLAIDANRTAAAEAEAHLDEPEELQASRERVAAQQEAVRVAEKHFKEAEYEADELRRKIEPLEQKLYQGSVHSPKELQDLERDVASLKRHRSELDDQALVAMEALEGAQRELAEAASALRELDAQREVDLADANRGMAQLQAELATLEHERVERVAGIDAGLLQLYDRLAATRQKRPVAKVVGGSCQGCRISLPMNLIKRARAGDEIVQCTSCERILYVS